MTGSFLKNYVWSVVGNLKRWIHLWSVLLCLQEHNQKAEYNDGCKKKKKPTVLDVEGNSGQLAACFQHKKTLMENIFFCWSSQEMWESIWGQPLMEEIGEQEAHTDPYTDRGSVYKSRWESYNTQERDNETRKVICGLLNFLLPNEEIRNWF